MKCRRWVPATPWAVSNHCLRKESLGRAAHPSRQKFSIFLGCTSLAAFCCCCWGLAALGQTPPGFPDGYDAVQVAGNSHKVIFENALVRVLEVTVPPTGQAEPMHHHRWPGFFLGWDTGGEISHIRYHTPDGNVRDVPSENKPIVAGHWTVDWMKPEAMHAIETVKNNEPPSAIPLLRVELKTGSP